MQMRLDAKMWGSERQRLCLARSGQVWPGEAPKRRSCLVLFDPPSFFCERETRGRRANAMRAKEEERDG